MRGLIVEIANTISHLHTSTRKEFTRNIQLTLFKFLVQKGWRTQREYNCRYQKIRRRDNAQLFQWGRIDIVGRRNNNVLAIEIDSGVSLKYKSIEKILQTGDIGLGIVKSGYPGTSSEHVKQVLQELQQIRCKEFWLIIHEKNELSKKSKNFNNSSNALKLSVEDSPNSAGVVACVIRAIKIALDRGVSGPLLSISAYSFKHPPEQIEDSTAKGYVEEFIQGKRER